MRSACVVQSVLCVCGCSYLPSREQMSWFPLDLCTTNSLTCWFDCSHHCQLCQVHELDEDEDIQRFHSYSVYSLEVSTAFPRGHGGGVCASSDFQHSGIVCSGFPLRCMFSRIISPTRELAGFHVLFFPLRTIPLATPQGGALFGALACWIFCFVEHRDDGVPLQWDTKEAPGTSSSGKGEKRTGKR